MGSLRDREVASSARARISSPICGGQCQCGWCLMHLTILRRGGGPRVVVSTGLGGLTETKNVSSPSTCESQYCGELRDREVACSASDRQGSNFESCVWRTVSSQSSHHPQEVLLAQFSLYVHQGGLKPDSFHFYPQEVLLA